MVCNLAGSPLQVHVASLTDLGKVYTASKLQRCIKQCRLKALFKLCETFVFWVGYRRKVFAQVALQKCIYKNCMENWLVVLQRGAVGINVDNLFSSA